jgi:hypothetical protein
LAKNRLEHRRQHALYATCADRTFTKYVTVRRIDRTHDNKRVAESQIPSVEAEAAFGVFVNLIWPLLIFSFGPTFW